ncbi:MAG: SDR family oxidoreductase [Rhizomicrobium sp.]
MTIAVTAATGHLGRLAIAELKEKVPAGEIAALARAPEKAADLGVAVRPADYGRPETLETALKGIATLLLISSSEIGQRARQHQNVIDAAKKAGVKHIAYTSILHADVSPIVSLAAEHRATEAALQASGIPHTLLRNGWYTENYTGSIPAALAGGAFIGSAGSGRISSAPRADYAAAAVAVLTNADKQGKVYELAGDKAYTLANLAAEIGRQTGRDIPYKNLSEADYAAALAGAGVPKAFAAAIANWDVGASQDALFDDGHQLSALIGRPTTSLASVIAESLK